MFRKHVNHVYFRTADWIRKRLSHPTLGRMRTRLEAWQSHWWRTKKPKA